MWLGVINDICAQLECVFIYLYMCVCVLLYEQRSSVHESCLLWHNGFIHQMSFSIFSLALIHTIIVLPMCTFSSSHLQDCPSPLTAFANKEVRFFFRNYVKYKFVSLTRIGLFGGVCLFFKAFATSNKKLNYVFSYLQSCTVLESGPGSWGWKCLLKSNESQLNLFSLLVSQEVDCCYIGFSSDFVD